MTPSNCLGPASRYKQICNDSRDGNYQSLYNSASLDKQIKDQPEGICREEETITREAAQSNISPECNLHEGFSLFTTVFPRTTPSPQ